MESYQIKICKIGREQICADLLTHRVSKEVLCRFLERLGYTVGDHQPAMKVPSGGGRGLEVHPCLSRTLS